MNQGRHFNFFLGDNFFFKFSMPPDSGKIWKKQHFICSNLTLFIVPFFLSFFPFFLFFLFFFLFFFFFLFPWEATAPSPPQMTPLVWTNPIFCTPISYQLIDGKYPKFVPSDGQKKKQSHFLLVWWRHFTECYNLFCLCLIRVKVFLDETVFKIGWRVPEKSAESCHYRSLANFIIGIFNA